MSIDPSPTGRPSPAHQSLFEAGLLARGMGTEASSAATAFKLPDAASAAVRKPTRPATSPSTKLATRSVSPHTPVESHTAADPDQWDGLLNRLGQKYNVPPTFLKAVMLSESGGRADAVGDQGHSVGLFQLNDHGYGAGMGDARFDPATNADRGARGLAEAWHAGENAGFTGEYAVRAAYDYSFNPGGGWAYQGDAVVRNMNQLLADQGQPALQ
jgi:soluble lytic murein transglycosylase-like protein